MGPTSASFGDGQYGTFQPAEMPAVTLPMYPTPSARTFNAGLMRNAKAVITPTELVDYAIDWTSVLASGETIISSAWSTTGVSINGAPASIQQYAPATTVWLSGGALMTSYIVTNTIITSGGRELQASFVCYVTAYNLI